jgi:outer membrane lipoprotein LolB
MRSTRTALTLALVLFAGACASVPDRPPAADRDAAWSARRRQLETRIHWAMQGRVALRTRDEGWQASLAWTREADRHEIDLSGPLGSGRLRLSHDRNGAQLRDSANKVLRAADAEQLLMQATGWRLPVDGLNFWVLGLPAPGNTGAQDIDAWGRLKTLRQSGWDIEFLGYVPCGDTELPSKLFMHREQLDSAGSETLEVRLVIDRWDLR